ncbi:uncharacterized protein DS421_5g161380 [Arachis hypogaea]|nr:uncharacterized protein DS421_5g161380 [Arachis hypogaea]
MATDDGGSRLNAVSLLFLPASLSLSCSEANPKPAVTPTNCDCTDATTKRSYNSDERWFRWFRWHDLPAFPSPFFFPAPSSV